jgi:Bacterial Ig domain
VTQLKVAVDSPTAGSSFDTSVRLAATASGPNPIAKVVFYKGERYRIATDTTAPYGYTWKPLSNIGYGSLVLRAVATDVKGNVAEASVPVTRAKSSTGTLFAVSSANASLTTVRAGAAPRWAVKTLGIAEAGAKSVRVVTGHTRAGGRIRIAIERRVGGRWLRDRVVRGHRAGATRFAASFRGKAGAKYRASLLTR